MSDVAEKAAEATADVVEETIDGVVEMVEVVRNNPVALAAVGVVGLAVGAAGGYFVAMKRLAKKYEEDLAFEIEQTRNFYANVAKVTEDGEPLTPQEVMDLRHGAGAAAEAVRRYQGRTEEELTNQPGDDELDETVVTRLEERTKRERMVKTETDGSTVVEEKTETYNAFSDAEFDYEEEVKHRSSDEPYIITHDEFFGNEYDLDQSKLTWFEKDATLIDEHSNPMESYDDLIGGDHLLRFGSGSKDPNIVYVRNARVGLEWEITRSKGSYLEEVLGLQADEPDSLRHSNRNAQQRRRREFRRGDE